MPTDPTLRAKMRRVKRAGVRFEHAAAKVLGTERYKANTGGPVDLIPIAGMQIQVKGGATVATSIMRAAMHSAMAASGPGELPAVYLIDTREGRNFHWICFPAKEWATWNGFGLAPAASTTDSPVKEKLVTPPKTRRARPSALTAKGTG